jgi:hypothetical protein
VETCWNIRGDKLKKLQRPIAQFLFGNFTAPPFFCPGKFDSPRPMSIVTTCYYIHNAEFCSTGFPSIYRCSTGLGGSAGVPRLPRRRANTTCSVVTQPRVRVDDSFAETANDSPALFPSNPLDPRINSSPNSNFAPECPVFS